MLYIDLHFQITKHVINCSGKFLGWCCTKQLMTFPLFWLCRALYSKLLVALILISIEYYEILAVVWLPYLWGSISFIYNERIISFLEVMELGFLFWMTNELSLYLNKCWWEGGGNLFADKRPIVKNPTGKFGFGCINLSSGRVG